MSVLQDKAKIGRYGYTPHGRSVNVNMQEVLFDIHSDRDAFQTKFKKSWPDCWPRLPHGQRATHVYRLLAVEDECDVQHSSKIRSAIRHKLVQCELVDFTVIDTRTQAIIHVDDAYDERPFYN